MTERFIDNVGRIHNYLRISHRDLLSALLRVDDVLPLIQQSIRAKAESLGRQLTKDFKDIETGSLKNRSMITIGG